MPNAEEFDAAAAAFDAAAQTTGTLVDPARVAMGDGVMVGGQLTELVTDELEAAAAILDRVTAELTRLAEVCRERAETCRAALDAQQEYEAAYAGYRADLQQWQVEHDAHVADPHLRDPGPPPDAPEAPPHGPDWLTT